jgi:hypothetical protein
MTYAILAQGWLAGPLIGLFIIGGILGLLATIFWLWMLIDAIMNEPAGAEKILWVVVILFTHLLGAILYFVLRKHGRTPRIT